MTNNQDDFFNELDKANASARFNSGKKAENKLAATYKVLSVLALIVGVCIFILGCIVYPINNRGGDNEVISLCWGAFIGLLSTSLITLAIAEVIQILHDIRAKLYESKRSKP